MKFRVLSVVPAAAFAVLICLSAMASLHAVAENPGVRCTDRTLYGSYGFTIKGTIVGPNIPIRGVVLQRYDGHGNITQVDHVVTAGVAPTKDWTPGTGKYSVNPDCTGDAVINSPSNPVPINLHFVITNNGNEIRQVVDINSVRAIGIKVN
jgi:hypothetical protein